MRVFQPINVTEVVPQERGLKLTTAWQPEEAKHSVTEVVPQERGLKYKILPIEAFSKAQSYRSRSSRKRMELLQNRLLTKLINARFLK